MSAEELPVVNVQENKVATEPLSARVLAVVLAAGGFTVAVTLLERVLGGGWRSWGSMTSSFLMSAYALIGPLGFSKESEDDKRAWSEGLMAGGAAGLLYGLIVRSILPGAVFGACVGAGSAALATRVLGKHSREQMIGAVTAGLLLAYSAGLLTPTRLIRNGGVKADGTETADSSESGTATTKSSSVTEKILGKPLSAKQMAKAFIQGKTVELGMSRDQVFTILGTPTKLNRTDFSKNADFIRTFQNTMDRAEGMADRSVRVPPPLDIYTWASKEDPGSKFVMVSIESDAVIGVMVNESKGKTTFQLDRPYQR